MHLMVLKIITIENNYCLPEMVCRFEACEASTATASFMLKSSARHLIVNLSVLFSELGKTANLEFINNSVAVFSRLKYYNK